MYISILPDFPWLLWKQEVPAHILKSSEWLQMSAQINKATVNKCMKKIELRLCVLFPYKVMTMCLAWYVSNGMNIIEVPEYVLGAFSYNPWASTHT